MELGVGVVLLASQVEVLLRFSWLRQGLGLGFRARARARGLGLGLGG